LPTHRANTQAQSNLIRLNAVGIMSVSFQGPILRL